MWLPLMWALLFVAFILTVVYNYVWKPYQYVMIFKKQGLPSLPFRPFIGNLPELQKSARVLRSDSKPGEHDYKFVDTWRQLGEQYGPVSLMLFGPLPRISISDPALVREVLWGNADAWPKSKYQKQNLIILGNGLLNANGTFWARQRRMLNPAFSHRNVKTMIGPVVQSSQEAVERWMRQVEQSDGPAEIDVNDEFSRLALDVIARAAFGANIGGGSDIAAEVSRSLDKYLELSTKRLVNGYVFIPGYIYMPTPLNRTLAACRRNIQSLMLGLIKRRREAQAQGTVGADLLASMLAAMDDESNERMTDEQLMDESVTFLLAGHETTAQLLTWAMYLLARHPEWQDRLRSEALHVAGPSSEPMAWDQLAGLKEMHMALLETLRLFPPVPQVTRITPKETQLGPYKIPPGVVVAVPVMLLHHSKELWGEDAQQFQPLRFADGVGRACKEPHCFLPFSGGPRNCIGQAFAMAESKVILGTVLRRFSWRLSPDYVHSLQMMITLRPIKGVPMIMERL